VPHHVASIFLGAFKASPWCDHFATLDHITIVERNTKNRRQTESTLLANMYDAVSAYKGKIRNFLASMGNHWGEWQVSPGSLRITFTATAAHDAYSIESGAVILSANTVKSTFKAWSAHVMAP